jgi:N-acetyl-gamma-glutamyl-phosphate reductase
MAKRERVGIVGFTGYSGAELVKILRRHPRVEPVLLEHRSQSGDEQPFELDAVARLPWSPKSLREGDLSLVLLATPHEVSLELAPAALEAGLKVVDLSGAFRLRSVENFRRWYKMDHGRPDLLASAAYGLPEYCRKAVKAARLVANPGCYPTAANLALRPLLTAGVIDREVGIVCDAKSGVSGAGKKPTAKTHFSSVTENFSAYAVLEHRHVPEVLLTSGLEEHEFSFTAQLIPVHRGILETVYVRTTNPLSRQQLEDIYRQSYSGEVFVRIYPDGKLPSLQSVAYTNYCDLGIHADPRTRRVVIVAAIDNLVKGAAGQAVQNMNLMLKIPETTALL